MRDFKLGVINYAFKLAIFLYVVVYAIIINRGYLKEEQIVAGSMTINAFFNEDNWENNLDYCSESTVDGCLYWDHYAAEYPPGKDFSVCSAPFPCSLLFCLDSRHC